MARIKLSALLQSMVGRYGGGVFRNWKGITVLSTLPDSVFNPNSVKQERRRSVLTCSSKLWATLNEVTRTGWASVAAYLTSQWENFSNEVGTHQVIRTPRGPYTDLGALTSVCSLLASVGLWDCGDPTPTAPVSHTAPSMPQDLNTSGDTDGIVCTWTDPSTWGDLETDGLIRVWCMSDDGTFFPQLAIYVASGSETGTITELVPRGGDRPIPLTPGYYYVQLDAVNEGGLRSAPGTVSHIIIAEPLP